jgi:hypothetical protein
MESIPDAGYWMLDNSLKVILKKTLGIQKPVSEKLPIYPFDT